MLFGVQRRNLLLLPPQPDDVRWLLRHLADPKLVGGIGFPEDFSSTFAGLYANGKVSIGIAHRRSTKREFEGRTGFCLLLTPRPEQPFFEFIYAIPKAAHRNAFTAIQMIEAMCFYAFDYGGAPGIFARVAERNLASQAILRRLGQAPWRCVDDGRGETFTLYWLSRQAWRRRKARLEASGSRAFLATMPDGVEPLGIMPSL